MVSVCAGDPLISLTGNRVGLPAGQICTLLLAVWLVGCASGPITGDRTLYSDLGGTQGITRITDNFLYYIGEDERVIGFFAESDIERFHAKVIEHLCEVSDGPCTYTGDSMVETHQGMDISEAQFNAIVDALINAMIDEQIPVRAQNELLKRLAALHGDIMGH